MKCIAIHTASLLVVVFIIGCSKKAPDQNTELAKVRALSMNRALPKKVNAPKDNPTSAQKAALGKLLFFDPILSGNKDVACATCHHPDYGYAEFLDVSIGVNGQGIGSKRSFNHPNDIPFVKRNSHTVLNTAYNGINIYNRYEPENAPMFWDMRVVSLEKQALEPIKSMEEMRGRNYAEDEILDEIIGRLKAIPEYQRLFELAFGESESINILNLGKAIAAFERTLVTPDSRFDQFKRGDQQAMSLSEKEGFEIFKRAGCANCHNGAMFTDYKPHVLGVPENNKLPEPDKGIDDTYGFRTPSLRNLRYTAPFMHNGSLKTLKSVLEFYEDISLKKVRNPAIPLEQLDPLVDELNLSVKDIGPIISFLNTLNDDNFDREIPESVPSGLPVGGNID